MIIVSLLWSHLQQSHRVNQTCHWYCRLWCRLLSTVASCSSRQLQVNWISSAKILSFRPRHSVDCNSCSATIFNIFRSILCEWWRVLMNSDSWWLSKSWDLFTDPAIHNAYHTPLHSVTICPARIQMCSARHAEDKTGSDKLSWEQTLIWDWALIQIRVSCTSRQTRIAHYAQQSTLTDPLHQACGTNKEKNNQDAATRQQPERTTSSTWANTQTWLHFSICACHPNILPKLSRDGHITQ